MPSALDPPLGSLNPSTLVSDVSFINDNSIKEYDSVYLLIQLYTKLFPYPDDPMEPNTSKYVLIKLLGAPDYFDSFKLYRVTLIDHYPPSSNSVTLINITNLAKFEDQITLSKCLIRSVSHDSIISLDKVIISLPPAIYDILNIKPASEVKLMFKNQFLKDRGGIVAVNDIIREVNSLVRLCEPVAQGFLDTNTSIVLVKDEQFQADHDNFEPTKVDLERAGHLDSRTNGVANGHVVDTATASTTAVSNADIANTADTDDVTLDLSSYLSSNTPNTLSCSFTPRDFKVKALSHPINVETPHMVKEDSDLYVFISSTDLATLGFSVFDGDVVQLSTVGEVSSTIFVKLLTVLEPNHQFKPGFVYLSPILLINLKIKESSKIKFYPVDSNNSSTHSSLSSNISVAKSVTISRLASPITMDKAYQQSFFAALKLQFHNTSKAVKEGDFVPVTIDTILAKTMFETFNLLLLQGHDFDDSVVPSGDPDAVAWFKITSINDDLENEDNSNESRKKLQYIIDPLKTRMILSGVDYVRVPSNFPFSWLQYLGLPQMFPYSKIVKRDPGLFKYAFELQKIITTCLEVGGKVNLKTSILINSMSRGLGKSNVIRELSLAMGLNLVELDAFDLINPGAELKTIGTIRGKIDKVIGELTGDNYFHVIYIKHIENLCVKTNENEQGSSVHTSLSLKVLQLLEEYSDKYSNLVIILSCNDIDKLNESLRLMVKFQIDVGVPNENERLEIFKFLIQDDIAKSRLVVGEENEDINTGLDDDLDLSLVLFNMRSDVSFKALALQSAGLTPRDLISIVKNAKRMTVERVQEEAKKSKTNFLVSDIILVGNGGYLTWTPEDFNKSINDARNQFSDSIGAPRIPNVKWEDIGGLDLVKDEILDTIDMPLKHPELFNNGLKKRSGILFYGPPGTGKTLLAKAIATNFSLNFFSVKGPELLNMYIGESEANVRRVFQKARDAKPCVIFFDELDSVAPKRGNQGDSGGVMDRIVSQLLAELDGMSGGDGGGDGVFVVGATNRPDLLDEALLRPGRFDKMLYLGISDTDEKQTKILEALTRKFQLSENVDLSKIAEKCSFTYTGADFYALCSDSMLNAMTRTANEVDIKIKKLNEELVKQGKSPVSTRWWFDNKATAEDTSVAVEMEDFIKAQSELVPSVSAEELQHYLRVRENFEGGKEKAKESFNENSGTPPIDMNGNGDFRESLIKRVEEIVGEEVSSISHNGSTIADEGSH